MKNLLIAAAAGVLVAGMGLAPAMAQTAPAAPAAAAGKLDVSKTPINDIIKNEKAKAILVKTLPEIEPYFDQIGTMSLAEVQPMSQGAIDDAKMKAIQDEFNKL